MGQNLINTYLWRGGAFINACVITQLSETPSEMKRFFYLATVFAILLRVSAESGERDSLDLGEELSLSKQELEFVKEEQRVQGEQLQLIIDMLSELFNIMSFDNMILKRFFISR